MSSGGQSTVLEATAIVSLQHAVNELVYVSLRRTLLGKTSCGQPQQYRGGSTIRITTAASRVTSPEGKPTPPTQPPRETQRAGELASAHHAQEQKRRVKACLSTFPKLRNFRPHITELAKPPLAWVRDRVRGWGTRFVTALNGVVARLVSLETAEQE